MIRGLRDRPSAETHFITVIKVRFIPAPLYVFNSCRLMRTLSKLKTLRKTLVLFILYVFSARTIKLANSFLITANQSITLLYI